MNGRMDGWRDEGAGYQECSLRLLTKKEGSVSAVPTLHFHLGSKFNFNFSHAIRGGIKAEGPSAISAL